MEKIPYLGTTILRWRAGNSTFLALPEHGARLMNWNLVLGDGSVRDILYWPELGALDNVAAVRGGNPVLFPHVSYNVAHGREGQYELEGRLFQSQSGARVYFFCTWGIFSEVLH